MVNALHSVDFDVGLFVAGEGDVGQDEQRLRSIGDVEGAIETHLLDTTLFASGLVERVGEGHGLVVNLVGEMRGQQRDGQRNGRFDLDAEFLAVVVGRHQAINFGRGGHFIFFVEDATPFEAGQHAVVHAIPGVVLDSDAAGRNKLLHTRAEDRTDSCDDWFLRTALVMEGNDHGPLGRQMALVSRAGDVFLNAEKFEIHGSVGILHGRVPFVGPGHGDGDGIARLDADVQVAASGSGMIDAAGVQAGGLHGDGFAVGGSPAEDAIILSARHGGAEQHRENKKVLHNKSICRGSAGN